MMSDGPDEGLALAHVVEHSREGMVLLDRDGRIRYANTAAARMLGSAPHALTGGDLASLLPGLPELPSEGSVEHTAMLHGRRLHARVVVLEGGACCYLSDVTEAHEVSTQRERTRRILDAVTDAFYTVDGDYRITDLNGAFARFVGRTREELIGRLLWELVPTGDEKHGRKVHFDRALAERSHVQFEIETGDGRWLLITAYPAEGGLAVFVQDVTAHKRAAEELSAAHASIASRDALLDLLFDAIPLGIALYDEELRYQRINAWLAGINGLPVEAHLGRTASELLPPALSELIEPPMHDVLRDGAVHRTNLTLAPPAEPDARRHWSLTYFPVRVAAGRMIGVGAIVQDVTGWRDAETALREREAQLEQAQAIAGIGSWEWTPDGAITWSGELYRITGADAADGPLSEDAFFARVHPDDRERVMAARQLLLDAHGSANEVPFRFLHPSREWRWFASRVRAMRAPDGRLVRLAGTFMDVTAQHEAAEALERARADADLERRRLQAVLEALPVGVTIADADGRMTQVTATMRQIWGGERVAHRVSDYAEWRGWWADTGKPVGPEEWALARALQGETVQGELIDIERFDGTRGTIHNNAAPVRDAEGRITGAVVIAVDLSERRQLEAQLRQAQKMEAIGLLAGGVAHDFNNLLTAILGHVELLRDEVPAESAIASDLHVIERAASRGADLTRQLLAFSRKQVLQPIVLDLNTVIADSERLLRRVLDDVVMIELDLAPGAHPVRADRGQLEQVVMNLAVNARDAMPTGGTLTIQTSMVTLGDVEAAGLGLASAGEYVRLVISDTGTGMSDAVRSRVFEPFFTTKELGKGTGLGLATVYGIVQQSAGSIAVESAPGRGASFTLYLPRAEGHVTGPVHRPAVVRGAGETVLVVEDEAAVRLTLRRTLERANYRVLEARHGADALLVWRERRDEIALVISDVRMPELDGFGLAEALRREDPDVRMVFLSGYSGESVELRPGDAFLAKPFDIGELLMLVRRALEWGRNDA